MSERCFGITGNPVTMQVHVDDGVAGYQKVGDLALGNVAAPEDLNAAA